MSSVSKMQIRGIRSFSPEKDEVIEFYTPLTMIVGANGCGKTTIIESLKYACTGSMPPNVRSGHSFINDPSMTDATTVKAHIKLRFHNRSDCTCVAVRSMQVLKKKGKLEFKGLDGVLRSTNEQGEKVNLVMKCGDIDRIIPEQLGISAAIIENVLFVHQEDSNWPMQEGIVLKKKFDDVFESTRYTKALDALTKSKKEFQSTAKDLKAELMELGAQLEAASESRRELQSMQENQETSTADLNDINDQLQQREQQLESCREILSAAREQAQQLNDLKQQLEQAEYRVQEKQSSVEKLLTDSSSPELQHVLDNFTAEMNQRTQSLEEMQDTLQELEIGVSNLREEEQRLVQQKGKSQLLQSKAQQLRDRLLQSSRSLERAHCNIGVSLGAANNAEFSSSTMRTFADCLQGEFHRVQQDGQSTVAAARDSLQQSEQRCDEIREKINAKDVEIRFKTEAATALQQEFNSKRIELTRLAQSQSEIAGCEGDFEIAQRNFDDFMSSYELKAGHLKSQIKDAGDQIRSYQEQIAAENELLQQLSLRRGEIAASDAALKQANLEVVQITTELSACFSENFDALSDQLIPTDAVQLEQLIVRLKERTTESQSSLLQQSNALTLSRNSFAAKEALIQQNTSQLHQYRQKNAGLSEKVSAVTDCILQLGQLLDDKLFIEDVNRDNKRLPVTASLSEVARVVQEMTEYAVGMESIAGANRSITKIFKKFRVDNPHVCPCCEQAMDAAVEERYESNVNVYFDYKKDLLGDYKHRNVLSNRCLQLLRKVHELQRDLGPHESLRQEIAQVELQLRSLREEAAALRTQIQEGDSRHRELDNAASQNSKALRSLHSIVARWQAVNARLADAQEKKKRLSQHVMMSQPGRSSDSRTLDEVELSQRALNEKKDALQLQKDRAVAEESALGRSLYSMKSLLSEAESNLERARGKGNKHRELEQDIIKVQSNLKEANDRKTQLVLEKEALAQQLSEKQLLSSNARSVLQQQEEEANQTLALIRTDRDEFMKLFEALVDIEKELKDGSLQQAEAELSRVQSLLLQKEGEIRSLRPQIEQLKSEISSQGRTKRNVQANIDLRSRQSEEAALRSSIDRVERDLQQQQKSADDLSRAEQKERRLLEQKQKLLSEMDVLRGKLEIYNQQAAELKSKLNNKTYKDIDERHRRKNIEFETTMLAVADLESYHGALDKALQNFHTLKIREINKIIRELWQQIYKGQDIDSIEIESGMDESSSASARSTRSYNYRVVMRKGDSPLDMRGRCSAGQKVLAAIVIRLALAETFCLSCGMLALDEPTTNLDEANKAGLAHALARIIMSRSAQLNFQLICITHDEDFVKMMSNELSAATNFNLPEFYFRVYRREDSDNPGKFFSHIERVPWEDM